MLTRIGVVLAVVAAAAITFWPRSDEYVVTADFADTTGIYVGNEVQYLGVPVGEITDIDAHGPVMRVRMLVDEETRVPRDAVAEILQSALLTDRFIQLGPVYKGGPTLADGGHIEAGRTRSPISFDELGASIDQLVVALDREGPDGRDIGDLLAVTADNLDGNGARIRELLGASRDALAGVNAKEPELQRIAENLRVVAQLLGRNDAMVRRFTTNLSTATGVVAGQTESLDQTLRSLSVLSTDVAGFIERNRGQLRANLQDVARVTATIHDQRERLDHIWDHMPVGSENIVRAYDPAVGSIRVQIAARDMAVFNQVVRAEFCNAFSGQPELCSLLTNAEGTGPLDVLFAAAAPIAGGVL